MIKLEKAATKIMAAIGTAVMLFLLFYSWKYTKRLVEPEYYLDEKDSILCDSSDSRDKACEGRRSGEHCGPVLCAKSSYGTGGR